MGISNVHKRTIWLSLCIMLVACVAPEPMTQADCELADWYALGEQDGSQGRPLGFLQTRTDQCAVFGVSPAYDSYRAGRQAGLVTYCQAETGFYEGLAGRGYQGVCPVEMEAAFLDAYGKGAYLRDLQRQVRVTEQALDFAIRESDRNFAEIGNLQDLLLDPDLSAEERQRIREDLKYLREEAVRDRRDVRDLQRQLAQLERELLSLEAALQRQPPF